MFAIKIFDEATHESIKEKLQYAIQNKIGVELCMYSELFLNDEEKELVLLAPNKIIHANHKYSIFTLAEPDSKYRKNFLKEIEFSKQCGITKMVIHIAKDSETGHFYTMPTQSKEEMFIRFFKFISELPQEYENFSFYVENTFETPDFFDAFFKLVTKYTPPQKIGMCFDIGHAKVWSGCGIEKWESLLSNLQKDSVPLHFHVHANNGKDDLHLPFYEYAEQHEYAYYQETNIMNLILQWNKKFNAMFSLEVPQKNCLIEADFWMWAEDSSRRNS